MFDWDAQPSQYDSQYPDAQVPIYTPSQDYALFQGKKIKNIHGKISWTTPKSSYMVTSASGTLGNTGTQITPIFSKGSEKIWKVAITYVGG